MSVGRLSRNLRRLVGGLIPALMLSTSLAVVPVASSQEEPRGMAAPKPFVYLDATAPSYRQLAAETEGFLRRDVLDVWFPRALDGDQGGFRSEFTRDWQPVLSRDGKFSVFQARMTWMPARIAMLRPDLTELFLPYARHGFDYLNNVLWDKQDGGFFWGLGEQGQVSSFYTDAKHMYGNSFCLYALAATYQATRDPSALALAQQEFRWMDRHAHDARNGGYFEWLTRDGKPIRDHAQMGKIDLVPVAQFPIGYKSMNTHIHLLESFSQLYEVWKDRTVRRRLEELLAIVRDQISVAPGVMNLYLTNDWRALPGHDSYGHDVEAAYLMLEAEDVLGHGHHPRTQRMARMLVDHALAYGWDETLGGFYRDGTTYGPPEDRQKEWWVQVEGLNALLLMHEIYGRATDVYFKAFQRQWRFITEYQLDHEFRGLYELVDADGRPVAGGKGRIWKEAYHEGRAMLNVSARLLRLAGSAAR